MANRRDVIAEQLRALADDLEGLWRAATHDPKAEARRERAWTILSGVFGAVSTIAARQIANRLWPILTGEPPPVLFRAPKARATSSQASAEEPAREDQTSETTVSSPSGS